MTSDVATVSSGYQCLPPRPLCERIVYLYDDSFQSKSIGLRGYRFEYTPNKKKAAKKQPSMCSSTLELITILSRSVIEVANKAGGYFTSNRFICSAVSSAESIPCSLQ